MTYIAFLRGINVGGNHKVPMADLRNKMTDWGYENVKTILNSGNVVFDLQQDSKNVVDFLATNPSPHPSPSRVEGETLIQKKNTLSNDNSLSPTRERVGVRGEFSINLPTIEATLEAQLSEAFGFQIPVILRSKDDISVLVKDNPFDQIEMHTDLRLYVSFLKTELNVSISLPYISDDSSFQILEVRNSDVVSMLDVSKGKTVNGMNDLEKLFGKNITTRNWNTIIKVLQ